MISKPLLAWLLVLQGHQTKTPAPDPIERLQPAVAQVVSAAGVGSGFLVRADGVLVTAYHVVANARSVWAHFPGGTAVEVQGLLSFDPVRDVAVVKLRREQMPAGLPVVPIRPNQRLRAAQAVAAIGYPKGGPQRLTRGVVLVDWTPSQPPDRSTQPTASAPKRYTSLIQFDAAVAPGSSGSPLFNAEGEAVGVVVSLVSGRHAVGFAIDTQAIDPLPNADAPTTSFSEATASFEGTPEALFSQASSMLHFWDQRRNEEAPAKRSPFLFGDETAADEEASERSAYEWALSRYVRAAQERTGFAEAHYNAALCYWHLDRRREAVAEIRKVAALWPDNVVVREYLVSEHAEAGRVASAEAEAAKLVRMSPVYAPGRCALAYYYSMRGEHRKAQVQLEAAARLKPLDSGIQMELERVRALVRQAPRTPSPVNRKPRGKPR